MTESNAEPKSGKICVGVIVGARGIKGDAKVKSFTQDPADVAAYGPVETDDGEILDLTVTGDAKGTVVVRIKGVEDRTQVEALKGQQLYIARTKLPEMDDDDEYYHADLIGLAVVDETDTECGTVIALYDFGAGDVIDIRRPAGHTLMLPFTAEAVTEIDLASGQLVVSSAVLAEAEAAPEKPSEENALGDGEI